MTSSAPDRWGTRLWVAQRASAGVLALCVLVHLATIVYATRSGLHASEILARTRGNAGVFGFYVVFAAAVAVHVPIGLRAIAGEWTGWRGRSREVAMVAIGCALFAGALRSLFGLYQ